MIKESELLVKSRSKDLSTKGLLKDAVSNFVSDAVSTTSCYAEYDTRDRRVDGEGRKVVYQSVYTVLHGSMYKPVRDAVAANFEKGIRKQ